MWVRPVLSTRMWDVAAGGRNSENLEDELFLLGRDYTTDSSIQIKLDEDRNLDLLVHIPVVDIQSRWRKERVSVLCFVKY